MLIDHDLMACYMYMSMSWHGVDLLGYGWGMSKWHSPTGDGTGEMEQ
jgi:hypothetical protein